MALDSVEESEDGSDRSNGSGEMMFSIFKRRLEIDDYVKPLMHIRGDGKILWQPRVIYHEDGEWVEKRIYSFEEYASQGFYTTHQWITEGANRGLCVYPRLYPWYWYARVKAVWEHTRQEEKILMEIREAGE